MNIQQLLYDWRIKADVNILLSMWNENQRHYHNLDHLNELIDKIDEKRDSLTEKEYEKLVLTALFHDIVYDPCKRDNEEKSADFFMSMCEDKSNKDILEIKQAILDTKSHKPQSKVSNIFCDLDMSIVESNFDKLLEWEKGIESEYIPCFGKEAYKEGRLKFLESLLDKYNHNAGNLLELIEVVKNS